MYIQRDWEIQVDEKQYSALMGVEFERARRKPGWEATLQQAASELNQAIRPAVCWEHFPVRETRHEKLVLENGLRLGGGPVVQLLGGAEELIVAVLTVGAGADRVVEAAQREGNYLKALLMHDLAAMAVDLLRQQFCKQLEEQASQQGKYTSTPISPGEATWSMEDQAVIFSLLDTDPIGVELNDALVMVPIKSLSLIVGMSTQPVGMSGADNCSYCTIQERCNYRRLRLAV
jgi:hypothetical protein